MVQQQIQPCAERVRSSCLFEHSRKNQLFQLDGKLYEQIDGVAMGPPLGPSMANTFMCSIKEKLVSDMVMPSFYHRFVDDTITSQRNLATAEDFLDTLNNCHECSQISQWNAKLMESCPFLVWKPSETRNILQGQSSC